MKYIYSILIILLLNIQFLAGQQVVTEFSLNQRSKNLAKTNYTLQNHLSNDFAILIQERFNFKAYLFNQDYNLKRKFDFDFKVGNNYVESIGYAIEGSQYSLILTNKPKTKFKIIKINFNSSEYTSSEVDLNFKGEQYLCALNSNNKFYVLTSGTKNEIIIRVLTNSNSFEVVNSYVIDLSKNQKLNKGIGLNLNLFTLVSNNNNSNLIKIDSKELNTLELASKENKIFSEKDLFYLTFDNNSDATLMFVLDMINISIQRIEFPYPKGKLGEFKEHNSFYLDNKLFQLSSSNKEMSFLIWDIEGNLLKEFYFAKDSTIDIKNSPIIQDGDTSVPFVSHREFEETSKFLRKITAGNVGVSVYKKGDSYNIHLGGYNIIRRAVPSVMPYTEGFYNSFNPTYNGFSSYVVGSKSTYFSTKLDANLSYVKEEEGTNIFEIVDQYKKSLKYVTAENVFYHNNALLYGFVNLKEDILRLVKFEN